MSKGKPIGLLGGAFDPVHVGHVRMALECMEALDLQEVNFVPAHIPPHKATAATGQHRLAMLEQALQPYPQLVVNDAELKRGGTSYTIDTLIDLRGRYGQQPLCFIMGKDAFDALPAWRRWQELTDYAHLVVIDRKPRNDGPRDERMRAFCAGRGCSSAAALHANPSGFVHNAAVSIPEVSSAQIRTRLRSRDDTGDFLPSGVHNYIKENRLYL